MSTSPAFSKSLSQLANSIPELFGAPTIPCPNCGETVELGSEKCKGCKMTKADYDAKQRGN